jgi:hypothetical protein
MLSEYLLPYMVRIAPGLVLGGASLVALRRHAPPVRIFVYILIFVLTRDAMTPMGLWEFGATSAFWLRFTAPAPILVIQGITSALLVVAMHAGDPEVRKYVEWFAGTRPAAIIEGMVGALVVAAPLLIWYRLVPIETRGGVVATGLLPAVLVVALLGNLYEEVLFRGYLQGYLETGCGMGRYRAGITSGLLFGLGHGFLALTVTAVGWPVLLFATYEGIVCGVIRARRGVVAAVLTHGLAIFLLASGLV